MLKVKQQQKNLKRVLTIWLSIGFLRSYYNVLLAEFIPTICDLNEKVYVFLSLMGL